MYINLSHGQIIEMGDCHIMRPGKLLWPQMISYAGHLILKYVVKVLFISNWERKLNHFGVMKMHYSHLKHSASS